MTRFRKIVSALILVPLAIALIVFAVANREIVTVSFDPFDPAQPAWSLRMPLFVLIFVFLIGGRAARRFRGLAAPGPASPGVPRPAVGPRRAAARNRDPQYPHGDARRAPPIRGADRVPLPPPGM